MPLPFTSQYRTLIVLSSFLGGILTQVYLHSLFYPLLLLSIGSFFPWRVVVAISIVGIIVGYSYTFIWRLHHRVSYPSTPLQISGTVTTLPKLSGSRQSFSVEPLQNIGTLSSGKKGKGKVLVQNISPGNVHYGDILQLHGRINPPPTLQAFNYPLYLEAQGVYGVIQPDSLTISPTRLTLPTLATRFSSWYTQTILSSIPGDEGAFLAASFTGDRSYLSSSLQTNLINTGTTHIVTLNLTSIILFTSLLDYIVPGTFRSKKLISHIGAGLGIYALTGFSTSAFRSFLLLTLRTAVQLSGRLRYFMSLLGVTLVILCLINPLFITDVGLQLAFSAYAGLTWLKPILEKGSTFIPGQGAFPRLVKDLLLSSLAITLAILPVSFFAFGQLPLLGGVANLALFPLLPFILLTSTIVVLGSFFPFFPPLISFVAWLFSHLCLMFITWCAHLPGATLTFHHA